MPQINCAGCDETIKNAVKEAKKYQNGDDSAVVVDGPDIYHTECYKRKVYSEAAHSSRDGKRWFLIASEDDGLIEVMAERDYDRDMPSADLTIGYFKDEEFTKF